jgi:hypothetical protein
LPGELAGGAVGTRALAPHLPGRAADVDVSAEAMPLISAHGLRKGKP